MIFIGFSDYFLVHFPDMLSFFLLFNLIDSFLFLSFLFWLLFSLFNCLLSFLCLFLGLLFKLLDLFIDLFHLLLSLLIQFIDLLFLLSLLLFNPITNFSFQIFLDRNFYLTSTDILFIFNHSSFLLGKVSLTGCRHFLCMIFFHILDCFISVFDIYHF